MKRLQKLSYKVKNVNRKVKAVDKKCSQKYGISYLLIWFKQTQYIIILFFILKPYFQISLPFKIPKLQKVDLKILIKNVKIAFILWKRLKEYLQMNTDYNAKLTFYSQNFWQFNDVFQKYISCLLHYLWLMYCII